MKLPCIECGCHSPSTEAHAALMPRATTMPPKTRSPNQSGASPSYRPSPSGRAEHCCTSASTGEPSIASLIGAPAPLDPFGRLDTEEAEARVEDPRRQLAER